MYVYTNEISLFEFYHTYRDMNLLHGTTERTEQAQSRFIQNVVSFGFIR